MLLNLPVLGNALHYYKKKALHTRQPIIFCVSVSEIFPYINKKKNKIGG